MYETFGSKYECSHLPLASTAVSRRRQEKETANLPCDKATLEAIPKLETLKCYFPFTQLVVIYWESGDELQHRCPYSLIYLIAKATRVIKIIRMLI